MQDVPIPNQSPAISVKNLSRQFRVPTREAGLRAALGSFFHRTYHTVHAVEDISFEIQPGEVVGFLGPNGAGKTTTLKMLSGLLHPSGGEVSVLGHQPFRRSREFLSRMTLVMGNRYQLTWDLPALDSFEMQRAIYGIPVDVYRQTRDELIELLDGEDLVKKPVRNLSLGERMKMEIIGSLLHRPEVLFMDEPTIGLDVVMQHRIHKFIREYNRRYGATVLLTSHNMTDVEALCRRVIVIHQGRGLFDGELTGLVGQNFNFRTIRLTLADENVELSGYGEVISREGDWVSLRVAKNQTAQITARLLQEQNIEDLTVEDPPIEDVIQHVFTRKMEAG
jgi:ABC-2 type transport system ATP-binding protein